jgi:Raf kinase inhibitor-like YbhB/YbcL family protein
MRIFLAVLIVIISAGSVSAEEVSYMKLKSPAFENNNNIPKRFTCDGEGVNPPLEIENIPNGAKSLALIVDDPDAPMGTFVHWVVYDIPIVTKIEENSVPGKQGVNTMRGKNWVSPCPPSGTHRYIFKLYALDTELKLKDGADKRAVEKAMESHVLGKAELIGLYKR